MSLIRSSMIAGVTTGLLGIGAMTLGDKESYKEPYFWTATVSTAIVGGLAWAVLLGLSSTMRKSKKHLT